MCDQLTLGPLSPFHSILPPLTVIHAPLSPDSIMCPFTRSLCTSFYSHPHTQILVQKGSIKRVVDKQLFCVRWSVTWWTGVARRLPRRCLEE